MSNDNSGEKVIEVSAKTLSGVSIGLLIVYIASVAVLFSRAETATADSWARYIVLLTGIESLVFAATGWLFGREVNRKRAEAAEESAKNAEARTELVQEALAGATAKKDVVKSEVDALAGGILDLEAAKNRSLETVKRNFAADLGDDRTFSPEQVAVLAKADLDGRIAALADMAKQMRL